MFFDYTATAEYYFFALAYGLPRVWNLFYLKKYSFERKDRLIQSLLNSKRFRNLDEQNRTYIGLAWQYYPSDFEFNFE